MIDTLETAAACGLSLRPRRRDEPALPRVPAAAGSPDAAFDRLMASWFPLTYVLNNLNRGLGVPDAYPFVLSQPAIEKLRFVHDVIAPRRAAGGAPAERHGPASSRPSPATRRALIGRRPPDDRREAVIDWLLIVLPGRHLGRLVPLHRRRADRRRAGRRDVHPHPRSAS